MVVEVEAQEVISPAHTLLFYQHHTQLQLVVAGQQALLVLMAGTEPTPLLLHF
jgi:hypothetical protein